PMQLRWRRQRRKSFSDQGNSKLSDSIASASCMSRRIIQRMCTFNAGSRWELLLIMGLLPCRPACCCLVFSFGVVADGHIANWQDMSPDSSVPMWAQKLANRSVYAKTDWGG